MNFVKNKCVFMQRYKNLSGDSGVYGFEIGEDYIRVQFERALKIYQYSYGKAGKPHVDAMKELALIGKGLSSYIAGNVRELYD
jgi:hypothetical protein